MKSRASIDYLFSWPLLMGHNDYEFIINDDLSVCVYGCLPTIVDLSGVIIKHYPVDSKEYKIRQTIKALKK